MILLIDNYDSFSYNLFQLVGALNPDIRVVRNDLLSVPEIEALSPEAILLSPGPGRPADAGICEEAVQKLSGKIPILGVCLGHQAICEAFGGTVGYAKALMHGKSSLTKLAPSCPLFQDLPPEIPVARYHSLAAKEPLPPDLEAAAVAEDGEIMALQHKTHPTFGLQFHPESILTPDGKTILKNFLTFAQNQKQEGSL